MVDPVRDVSLLLPALIRPEGTVSPLPARALAKPAEIIAPPANTSSGGFTGTTAEPGLRRGSIIDIRV